MRKERGDTALSHRASNFNATGFPAQVLDGAEPVLEEGPPALSAQYAQILRSLPFGLSVWWLEDPRDVKSFQLLLANRSAAQAFGLPVRELIGKLMGECAPEWFDMRIPELLRDVALSRHSRDLEAIPYAGARLSGRTYASTAFPLPGRCVAVICEDVTERGNAENSLKLLLRTLDAANEAADVDTALARSLQTVCILGGWQVGQAWVPDGDGKLLFCSRNVFYSERPARAFREISFRTEMPRGTGLPGIAWARLSPVWVEDLVAEAEIIPRSICARNAGLKSALAFPVGSQSRLAAIFEVFSTSARKADPRIANVMRELGTQLGVILERRELSAGVLRIQDEERRNIARELHDSTAQTLSALSLQLSILKNDAVGLSASAAKMVHTCHELAKQACDEIQDISHLLHPPALDEVGLCAAIRWYAAQSIQRMGVLLELDLPSDLPRLTSETKLALFRVFQEALSNSHRHSGTKRCRVKIHATRDSIELHVTDYGKGIRPELLKGSEELSGLGVGILGMQERLKRLKGELIISSDQHGTTVLARLPL